MIYGSVCSGIEAASAAWHPLGWTPSFFSEIDAFPRAVLAHRFPEVPLHGDFTTIQAGDYRPIDLLVGGTPCQSFSIAGLRGGLDDDRGNLALEYLRLADRLRPTWLVWENVPGVLSTNGGRDFGSILGGLVELGYGFAYRVLDAQWFGVAQRRRRVFVVGHLGDWRPAAAVLFERHSLRGDPPPSRTAGKGTAGTIGASSGDWSRDNIGESVIAFDAVQITSAANRTRVSPEFPASTLSKESRMHVAFCATGEVFHTLRADGFDASEDGTGRGNGAVVQAFDWQSGGDSRGLDPKDTAQLQRCQTPAVVGPHLQVRRLTPTECERLQGFPDGWTAIPYRGKPASDGPRYKALGNSMAVPVMAWIGRRIAAVENLHLNQRAA
jgi:DNA (cytosine-5)-methyltransferase 1